MAVYKEPGKDVILITGSSGLIGHSLCERLKERFKVVGLDVKPPLEKNEGVDYLNVDLTSDHSVEETLKAVRKKEGNRLGAVIHLAAYYDFSGEPSPKYEQVTVQGTGRLLRGLRNFEVELFAFTSTLLVHAPCNPGQKINEDWPLNPKWDYPESKVRTEKLIFEERNAIPAVILRVAGIYDDECHSLPLSNQIQRVYERRLTGHVYPGDLARGQPFIHLEDLLDAFSSLVARRGELDPELILLLGEEETVSYGKLQEVLGRLIHNESWPTIQMLKSIAKTGAWAQGKMPFLEEPFIKPWMIDLADDHYELDISRAKTILNWEPKHSLLETLPKMIEALNRDPIAWYRSNKLSLPSHLEKQKAA